HIFQYLEKILLHQLSNSGIKHEYIKERVRESLERTYCKVPTGNSCEVEYVLSKCTKCKKIKKDYTNEPKVIDKEGQPPLTGTGAFILKKRKLAISMIGKK
ncbi:MAG: hypothetical protein RR847_02325, partial [Bacilli bacterium]